MRQHLKKSYVITVDMGGTKMLGCVLNSKLGIISRVKIPTESGASASRLLSDIVTLVKKSINVSKLDEDQFAAICLGVPGSVNPDTGVIASAPNLGIKNYNIKEKLQSRINIPVLIENDVNLGALGIKSFGVGKKSKNMLAVFIGTGIGGGLILNNQIFRGSRFYAGEIGHINVEENGPLCGCGNRGCIEAVASRTAIVNNIIQDLNLSGKKSVLTKLIKAGTKIKSKSLQLAVKKNDEVVIRNISGACYKIGKVLAGVCSLLNLDLIVLGGGLVEALPEFILKEIKNSFNQFVLAESGKGVKILASTLGDDAAIWGGIALAKEFLDIEV